MDPRLSVLHRILESVGITPDVSSLSARKQIQKAIYLVQEAGLRLGYAYGWYVRGPYSRTLAHDYYAMAAATSLGESVGAELRDDVIERLQPIKKISAPPPGSPLAPAEWLELVASVHFLRTSRRLDDHGVDGVLQREKATLAPFRAAAVSALQEAGLLN